MNVSILDIACYYPKRDVVVPPLLTQTHVIPPKGIPTTASETSAPISASAAADSAADDAADAATYGGRTIRVLLVTSASSIADASSDSIKVERMHHNYAVEKWLIELHTSHAAAIYGWKVVFRGDGEETLLGILTHHSLVALPSPSPPPTHTHSYTRPMQQPFTGGRWCFEATARKLGLYTSHAAVINGWKVVFRGDSEEAGLGAAAGDSAGGADGGGGGGAAAAGDSAGGVASAAGAGAAAAAAAGGAAGDNSEWGESVFCLVPPSRAQWTVQLAKAILSGCIPVTFLRANDNPWAASLHHQKAAPSSATATAPASAAPTAPSSLNYPLFSLNVDPADLHSLPRRLQDAFDQPGLVARLQHNLGLVQVGLVQVGTGVGGSAGEARAGGHWGGWDWER
ncbi:unnamed protein product [Closterium sp. Naga37s-1]|nr:unnamed protein product [Closterium sp. Naga37s-1]